MELNTILDVIMKQGIWCILFCYLFFSMQKDSKSREEKLMLKLNDYNKALTENTKALESINHRLSIVEDKIN